MKAGLKKSCETLYRDGCTTKSTGMALYRSQKWTLNKKWLQETKKYILIKGQYSKNITIINIYAS